MLNFKSNKTKGFTLIEVVVALGIIVMLSGFVVTSLAAIPQAKVRGYAETIKSEFELTRNFAKTHGGSASFSIEKVDNGINIVRTLSVSIDGPTVEESLLKDVDLVLSYKINGENDERELGVDATMITVDFSQTDGAVIGARQTNGVNVEKCVLDSITITNGGNIYTLIIEHDSGMMYYDYEIDSGETDETTAPTTGADPSTVPFPCFIASDGESFYGVATVKKGQNASVQPQISYDAKRVRISGEYRARDVSGPNEYYVITFTLKNPYEDTWEDGSTEPRTLKWQIVE